MIALAPATSTTTRARPRKCRGCHQLFPVTALTWLQEATYFHPEPFCITCASVAVDWADTRREISSALQAIGGWQGRQADYQFSLALGDIEAWLYSHPHHAALVTGRLYEIINANPFDVLRTIREILADATVVARYEEES